jgi:hypothetical protein
MALVCELQKDALSSGTCPVVCGFQSLAAPQGVIEPELQSIAACQAEVKDSDSDHLLENPMEISSTVA